MKDTRTKCAKGRSSIAGSAVALALLATPLLCGHLFAAPATQAKTAQPIKTAHAAPAHKPAAHPAVAQRRPAAHPAVKPRWSLPVAHNAPVLAGSQRPRVMLASALTPIQPIPLLDQPQPKPKPVHHTVHMAPIGPPQEIGETMHVGQSEVYEFDGITTTAVGDPTIADIVPLSTRRLLVNAKTPGITTIFVFDSRGKNTITVTVTPASNMGPIADQIEQEIGIPTVTVHPVNDTIFLEGSVPTQAQADLAEQIAKAYSAKVINVLLVADQQHVESLADKYVDLLNSNLSTSGVTAKALDSTTIALTGKYAIPVGTAATPGVGEVGDSMNSTMGNKPVDPLTQLLKSLPPELHVVNLINFQTSAPQQVLVRAKIIDIDRTGSRALGLDWGSANYEQVQIGNTGNTQQQVVFNSQPIMFAQAPGGLAANLLGGGGPLGRVLPWAAQLNALITENKARVLSEPSLLVLDGNEGSMLVGGEFPVPVLQGGNGAGVTVQFKPFGIRLNVTPTIVTDDTVQMTVTPEVSSIDFANAVQFNGGVIPGVDIRRATTTLQMKSGDTLVIGGLYNTNDSKNITRIPILSSIPVLGEFFKNTTTKKEEHELLVLIESEIVTTGQEPQGVLPPKAGSLENLDIRKPFIPRKEFDEDFPDIQNRVDIKGPKVVPSTGDVQEAPKVEIALPAASPEAAGK